MDDKKENEEKSSNTLAFITPKPFMRNAHFHRESSELKAHSGPVSNESPKPRQWWDKKADGEGG